MARQTQMFKKGDVVSVGGKPAYITGIDASTGQQHISYTLIDTDGKLTGPSKQTYGGYGEEVRLIDFASVEVTVHLPEQWQKTLVPVAPKTDFNTTKHDVIDDEQPDYHPAYAITEITRQSGVKKLFMSGMKHHHFICLKIRRATRRRSLHEDRASGAYGKGTDLIEVFYSEAQWGRLLSSVGMGGGVPTTLSYVGGKMMPGVPEYDENEKFHAEVEKDGHEAAEKVAEMIKVVEGLMDKPSVNKSDRKDLLDRLQGLHRHVAQNMPFVVRQYDERMEKIIVDAKTEVESFLMHTAQRLGIEKLMDTSQAPTLLIGNGKEKPDLTPYLTGPAATAEECEAELRRINREDLE